jgi:hypothetical protein
MNLDLAIKDNFAKIADIGVSCVGLPTAMNLLKMASTLLVSRDPAKKSTRLIKAPAISKI